MTRLIAVASHPPYDEGQVLERSSADLQAMNVPKTHFGLGPGARSPLIGEEDKMRQLKQAFAPEPQSDRPSNARVLQSCSLFNALDEASMDRLVEASFMAYAERGEAIWLEGAPSEFSGVVGLGFVKLTRGSPRGQEVAVELLGPGQAFGLLAAIEGRPFPLNAIAVTNCWYLKVPTRALNEVYARSGHFKDQIVRTLGPRLRRAHGMMSRLTSGTVEERIASVLFILGDSYGKQTPKGIRIQVPLTRHDVGEMAGTTVETTIRVMSKWQKRAIISTDRQVITILNPDALQAILRP